jgi:SAM-dependent methyltransferase
LIDRKLEPAEELSGAEAADYRRLSERHLRFIDLPFVRKAADLGVGKGRVLDVGCGPGHTAVALARRCPGLVVYALDYSRDMLDAVRENALAARVSDRVIPVQGDAGAIDFPDGHFDLVICLHTLHHLPDPFPAIKEMGRVLAPDGALMIRDLMRPRSLRQAAIMVAMSGFLLKYDPQGQRQYYNSLLAAFTHVDAREFARATGLAGVTVARRITHHFDLIRPARTSRARAVRASEGVRTRRPLSLNNSLAHGICNYNCQTCGVNKASYHGPREYQPYAVTAKLIERVKEAARAGIRVRYIANSGDGEPTLHPQFAQRMGMFGRMIREWDAPGLSAPEVGVVTNGLRLLEPGILDAIADNGLTLLVSFPTPEPEAYGQLVMGRPEMGAELLARVAPGIEKAMKLRAAGRLSRLYFHVSPPDREVVCRDFPKTVEFLTVAARRAGLDELDLVLFPATSNRSGLVRNKVKGFDAYPALFKAYHGRAFGGVRVRMIISYRRFFRKTGEILDLIRSFDQPCMWNAHLFVTAAGDSICCNDQAVCAPQGNVLCHSIAELMVRKERHLPDEVCAGCDQRPDRMQGNLFVKVFSLAARARMALARCARRGEALTENPRPVVVTRCQAEAVPEPIRARQVPPAATRPVPTAVLSGSGERDPAERN